MFPTEARHQRLIFTVTVEHPRTTPPISMDTSIKNDWTQETGVNQIASLKEFQI